MPSDALTSARLARSGAVTKRERATRERHMATEIRKQFRRCLLVRGHHVQPAVPPRLRQTTLLRHVVQVLVAELLHRRDDRADRRVAEGAERLAADVVR